jgi:6-phosphofructokinase 1
MTLQRIGVLTSGGDAPGMNAALRAAVRSSTALGAEIIGIRDGYRGLLQGDFEPFTNRSVAGIVHRGGTFLGSAREPEFLNPDAQQRGIRNLRDADIEGLLVIGGNGSQSGSLALHEQGFPTIGVASTIDNDLALVDTSIGVDTALNTATQMIDRLRDTATSHHRAFVIEVMGRNSGHLALMTGLASGAIGICTPEFPRSLDRIVEIVRNSIAIGKEYFLIVVAEGHEPRAADIARAVTEAGCIDSRVSVLGHVQRGGPPLVFDRLLATRSATMAAEALVAGKSGYLAGLVQGDFALVPASAAIKPTRKVTTELLQLAERLSQ